MCAQVTIYVPIRKVTIRVNACGERIIHPIVDIVDAFQIRTCINGWFRSIADIAAIDVEISWNFLSRRVGNPIVPSGTAAIKGVHDT